MRNIKTFEEYENNESSKNKLPFEQWLSKYFDKDRDHNYWTSNYEKRVAGFSPSDMSRYRMEDLKEEYKKYLNDTNDFLKYDE